MPASLSLADGVAAGDQLPPQVREALGQLDQALLVVHRQQGPHDVISSSISFSRLPRLRCLRVVLRRTAAWLGAHAPGLGRDAALRPGLQLAQRPGHRGGVQRALGDLDPFVQRLLGVAGQHRDHLLGQDRPGVHLQGGQVHGAPGLGHAGGQGVAHAVPAREGRQQGGVRVQDAVREGAVHRLGHDGAEAGHGHEVDLVRHQRGGHGRREAVTVEVGAEAAVDGSGRRARRRRRAPRPGPGRRRAGRRGRW